MPDFIRDRVEVDYGDFFDFRDACATHDYLADLQRHGNAGFSEPEMDDQFLQDMLADCEDRNFTQKLECKAQARLYRAGVQEGDYAPGDKVTNK